MMGKGESSFFFFFFSKEIRYKMNPTGQVCVSMDGCMDQRDETDGRLLIPRHINKNTNNQNPCSCIILIVILSSFLVVIYLPIINRLIGYDTNRPE